jgi:CheY-like chemotaxis protein
LLPAQGRGRNDDAGWRRRLRIRRREKPQAPWRSIAASRGGTGGRKIHFAAGIEPFKATAMSQPLSILIVEDEPLIAMMLEDFVDTLGHRVAGTCDSVSDALGLAEQGGFDVAILDVRLRGGEMSWPVADVLADRGVAFVLATGGHVEPPPSRHADVPHLAKPFTMDGVKAVLDDVAANA